MKFGLQTGTPRIVTPPPRTFQDLASAMQSLFPMMTEDAILVWNHVPIRMSYKYDLSIMLDDLVPLLERLLDEDDGSTVVGWGSDTFCGHWMIQWGKGTLSIDATWDSCSGGYERLLNSRGTIELPVASFMAEWRGVLAVIAGAVDTTGAMLESNATLRGLRRVLGASSQRGQLYGTATE